MERSPAKLDFMIFYTLNKNLSVDMRQSNINKFINVILYYIIKFINVISSSLLYVSKLGQYYC